MSKSVRDYLRDLLHEHELDDVAEYTRDGKQAFLSDKKTQKAVTRSYEVVGEICKRPPTELRAGKTQIEWRKLTGFRDFLAHNYELIALRFVWDAVEDLPNLRAAVVALLESLPPDEQPSQGQSS